MNLTKEQRTWLDGLKLGNGTHDGPENGACVMEAVAFVAREKWSDHPACASEVIGAFLRNWNDSLSDADRQMLKPYVLRLVGTAAPKAIEERRARLAQDWMIRVFTPTWLELAGLTDQAQSLRELNEIVSSADLKAAQPKLGKARAWAAAAWAAAGAAAWAAAGAAARATAWAAAGATAWEATAWAEAAWEATAWAEAAGAQAAGDAAWAAAWAAARDEKTYEAIREKAAAALDPTVKRLQRSALDLLDRMIALQPKAPVKKKARRAEA
jgi:hypothetical protein